jgi:hypothetical protein
MRTSIGVLAVVILGLVCLVASSAASGGHGSHCNPAGSKLVAWDKVIRIFSLQGEKGERLLGCVEPSGRATQISPSRAGKFRTQLVRPIVVNRAWVAAAQLTQAGRDTHGLAVVSRDLRTRQIKKCNVGSGQSPSQAGKVVRVVLTGNGSVAWAGRGRVGLATKKVPIPQIVACDHNRQRILDSGEGLQLTSLSLHGSSVTWLNSGVEHSATLR